VSYDFNVSGALLHQLLRATIPAMSRLDPTMMQLRIEVAKGELSCTTTDGGRLHHATVVGFGEESMHSEPDGVLLIPSGLVDTLLSACSEHIRHNDGPLKVQGSKYAASEHAFPDHSKLLSLPFDGDAIEPLCLPVAFVADVGMSMTQIAARECFFRYSRRPRRAIQIFGENTTRFHHKTLTCLVSPSRL